MRVFVVLFACILRSGAAYLNAYDQDLHYNCPHEYQAISHVESIHDNHKEDRMFDLSCSDVTDGATASKTTCYITGACKFTLNTII